jgi:hypothetical protein
MVGMNSQMHTLLFLLLAIVFYIAGLTLAATAFLVLGMLAEAVFWVRLFRGGDGKPRQ